MPEGPELAYSRDRLRQVLVGHKIVDILALSSGRYDKKSPEGLNEMLQVNTSGRLKIESIDTKGKFMSWKLSPESGDAWFMHCTYGMSGAWQLSPTKHAAIAVDYNVSGVGITRDVRRVYFNDPRHFGTVKFVRGEAAHRKKLSTLGPCILNDAVTSEIFAKNMLRKPTRTIAEALMDQSGVAGVGNYIKAEGLHRAGISPWRRVVDIEPHEYVTLCEVTLNVARESYASQGATISTYRTVDGGKGTTQFDFQVYSRRNCPKGHVVRREETPEGRTSHWCPTCQR